MARTDESPNEESGKSCQTSGAKDPDFSNAALETRVACKRPPVKSGLERGPLTDVDGDRIRDGGGESSVALKFWKEYFGSNQEPKK